VIDFLLDLEPGLAKNLQHRPVVDVSHRPEVRDAVVDRQLRQTFEQQGAQALAVKCIIYGKGDLGKVIVLLLGEIRARGNDVRAPATATDNHEAELFPRIRGITQRIHPISPWRGQGEKALLPRLWGKLIEEGEQPIAIMGLGDANSGSRAVT
jgi:hypothetical protein